MIIYQLFDIHHSCLSDVELPMASILSKSKLWIIETGGVTSGIQKLVVTYSTL